MKPWENRGMQQKGLIATVLAGGIGVVIFFLLANLAFWGGLIYFGFWCARHFGVI